MLVLILCALAARWQTRTTSPSTQRTSSALAGFTSERWQSVYAANIGKPRVELSDPDRIAALVHLLAEPADQWLEGSYMGSYLGFAEIVFVGSDSRETRFLLSDCPVICTRQGSGGMSRYFSRDQIIQLAGFFRTPGAAGPTMLDVDDLNFLLESGRPLAAMPQGRDLPLRRPEHPYYPQKRQAEVSPELLANVVVDPVWRNGGYAARVGYSGENALSRLGIRSGDLILSIDEVPVWSPNRLGCAQWEAPEAPCVRFRLERGNEIAKVEAPIRSSYGLLIR